MFFNSSPRPRRIIKLLKREFLRINSNDQRLFVSGLKITRRTNTFSYRYVELRKFARFFSCGHFTTQRPNILSLFIAFAVSLVFITFYFTKVCTRLIISVKKKKKKGEGKPAGKCLLLTLLFVHVCFMSSNLEQSLAIQAATIRNSKLIV